MARLSRSPPTTPANAIARVRRSSASSTGPSSCTCTPTRAPPKSEIDSDAKRMLEQTGQSGAVDRDAAAIELRVPPVRWRGRGARVARQARPSRLLRPHRRLPADGDRRGLCHRRFQRVAVGRAKRLRRAGPPGVAPGTGRSRNRRPGDHAAAGRPSLRGEPQRGAEGRRGRPPRWSASPCRWRSRCCS